MRNNGSVADDDHHHHHHHHHHAEDGEEIDDDDYYCNDDDDDDVSMVHMPDSKETSRLQPSTSQSSTSGRCDDGVVKFSRLNCFLLKEVSAKVYGLDSRNFGGTVRHVIHASLLAVKLSLDINRSRLHQAATVFLRPLSLRRFTEYQTQWKEAMRPRPPRPPVT